MSIGLKICVSLYIVMSEETLSALFLLAVKFL